MASGGVGVDCQISPGRKFSSMFRDLDNGASDGDLETGQSGVIDSRAIMLRGAYMSDRNKLMQGAEAPSTRGGEGPGNLDIATDTHPLNAPMETLLQVGDDYLRFELMNTAQARTEDTGQRNHPSDLLSPSLVVAASVATGVRWP